MCLLSSATLDLDATDLQDVPDCVPSDRISRAAYQYAREHLHPAILNHSIRIYIYARTLALQETSAWSSEERIPLLFAACILHDIGATSTHNGTQRFEVEGGDAAVAVLRNVVPNMSEQDLHDVWVAIALHTSAGIAERITPLARLVRLAVAIDFKRHAASTNSTAMSEEVERTEKRFPRGPIEKVLGDVVVEQAMQQPTKAPAASWPGILLKSAKENPGWDGVNKAF